MTISRKLAPKYTFGYYGTDDIEQEAILIAFSKISKYNAATGPLQAFLYAVIGNGLKNFKRNKYHRLISKKCVDPNCQSCESCYKKHKYINTKKNIMSPEDISEAADTPDNLHMSALENLEMQETLDIIDLKLPLEMRSDYLKMRSAIRISNARRLSIEAEILKILEEYYNG